MSDRTDITELNNILNAQNEPDIKIGKHCLKPFECEYKYHCWKNIPQYSIFNIYDYSKIDTILENTHSYNIDDIPKSLIPNNSKAIDIECYQNKSEHIDKKAISNWLSYIEYPLYFLDYETFSYAIPILNNTRPFQIIPFQFSLYKQIDQEAKPEYFEFIHKNISDPREDFIKELIRLCDKSGSIIVYYQKFETNRNKELAKNFPQYANELNAINNRVVYLFEPFKNRWIYSYKQQGSASLKKVLPSFTDLSYDNMNINNGSDAMNQYLSFIKGNLSMEESFQLFKDLSEYCKLDVYALIQLLDKMRKLI